jgi:hypothetical protein
MTITSLVPVRAMSSRWGRLRGPATTLSGLVLTTAVLRLRDPHTSGSWGYCPSKLLLGVDCPGCGGLRAVNDLTHLDLVGAASSNLLFVLSLPLIAWVFGSWVRTSWRGERYWPGWAESRWLTVGLVSLMAVFAVVRNLPPGAWLHS